MSSVLRVFGRIVRNASRFHMLVDGQNFMKSCRQLMKNWLTRSLQRSGKRRGVSATTSIYFIATTSLTSSSMRILLTAKSNWTILFLIKECPKEQQSPISTSHSLPVRALRNYMCPYTLYLYLTPPKNSPSSHPHQHSIHSTLHLLNLPGKPLLHLPNLVVQATCSEASFHCMTLYSNWRRAEEPSSRARKTLG